MEFEKAKRGLQKLSLLIIDIDFFKKINDQYGHVKADELLKKLAEILVETTRNSDIVARFGGEEFIILFPETNLAKAKEVSSRIRLAVKKDKLLKTHNLTISGGLTEYIEKDTIKKMATRADKALYDAKNSGRDKLVLYGQREKGEFYVKENLTKKIRSIKKTTPKKMQKEFKEIFQ